MSLYTKRNHYISDLKISRNIHVCESKVNSSLCLPCLLLIQPFLFSPLLEGPGQWSIKTTPVCPVTSRLRWGHWWGEQAGEGREEGGEGIYYNGTSGWLGSRTWGQPAWAGTTPYGTPCLKDLVATAPPLPPRPGLFAISLLPALGSYSSWPLHYTLPTSLERVYLVNSSEMFPFISCKELDQSNTKKK